ncbi:MAG: hypothetical protein CL923_11220 [Deltaproteobacteria bacterium]|nr:hypothetical protein [Deltaproteobacteria bacterium]MDP7317160.1 FAD-dependent thymidylate synthase [SAR324 cluster bacterium]MDP7629528.1 FAD-dependent thymidylate synthase [SAR324 cluster bacterium]
MTGESFTPDEQARLAPYVTNTDRSIFALTNLPEVIKGALFSRYSRSTLGLRHLLLREFIEDEAAEFSAIQGSTANTDQDAALAVGRAQSFYDRILDGYGDDSIGELGGGHLAVEEVSILATKTLEDARIGGSPLEKSTRYVSFGQKVKGDYRFYKEPRLLASQHRERYLNTCRTLFETYVQLNEPVREYVRSRLPRDPDAPAAAYERSVRALSFDLIRGLLPAATLTNMGVFGNGRFFESLISRLRIEPLQEFQDLAQTAWEELAKVVPSFIRRAHPDHRHFQSYAAFTKAQRQQIQSVAAQLEQGSSELLSPPARTSGEVCLVEWDADAEIKLLAALLYEHTALPLQQVQEQVRQMPNAERKRIFRESIALREHRRHKPPRALERVFYTFDLLGDYGMYRDLHRHRMLTQWRQPLTTRFGYDTPPELEDAGLTQTYHAAMAQAKETFEAIAADFPNEAQYVVPMAYRIRWSMHVNLRALTWLVELRSTPQGHPGYRHIAQALFREVQRVQSRLAEWMKFVDLDGYTLGRLDAEVRQESKSCES